MIEGAPVLQDVTSCKGCGEKIIFVKTEAGKFMPVNVKPERRIVLDADKIAKSVTTWTPHWATCEKADDFRKK